MFKKKLLQSVSNTVLLATMFGSTALAITSDMMSSGIISAEKVPHFVTYPIKQAKKVNMLLMHFEGTEQDKAEFKKALDMLNKTKVGQETLLQAPDNIRYVFKEEHPSSPSTTGTYSKDKKTITLYRNLFEKEPLYITLAHEMRHAIQDKRELLHVDSLNQKDEAIIGKLEELDTKVHDIVLEHQLSALPENQNKAVSPQAKFYTNLLTRAKENGLSDKEAEQSAKDTLIQFLWTGGQLEHTNPSSISQDMQTFSAWWHSTYNEQNFLFLLAKETPTVLSENNVESFINAYRERLGTTLDASFFRNIPNMTFSTDEKDGSSLSQLYAPDGSLLKTNKQFYDISTHTQSNVAVTYHKNGKPSQETNYVNSFKHGKEKTYYENGQLSAEATYHYGKLNGVQTSYDIKGAKIEKTLYQTGEKVSSEAFDSEGFLLCKTEFKNGQPQTLKQYDKDGLLYCEIQFINEQFQIEKLYHENGLLCSETQYVNDQPQIEKLYHDNGSLCSKTQFVNGQPLIEKEYDENGLLCYETQYVNGEPAIGKEYNKDGKVVHTQQLNQTENANAEAKYASLKETLNKMEQPKASLLKNALRNNGR